MKVYRILTKVSEKGTIQLPNYPHLFNKEVEIIILPKSKPRKSKMKAEEFVDKWAGFLSDKETRKAKYNYLSNKYK